MILYIDRADVPDVEAVRPDVLRWCIRKAEQAQGRYRRLMDYYLGQHPILLGAKPGEVRVAANYARYVVDTTLGYYLGEPVKYDANHQREDGGKLDLSPLLDTYDAQRVSRQDLEIGRTMGIMGDCLELCYASTDDDPRPRSARISPDNGILICDTTVEHRKLFAVVWERRERPSGEWYYFATVYTDRTERDYISGSLETSFFTQVGETREHWFGAVPVIAYCNNDQRQGDFEQVTSLIDAYDQLMSDRVTDKRKFVDALLVFFGMTLAEGDEAKLAREKFIDGAPLDARAEYIQKTFNEGEVQTLADALVREIHKQTLTVDMSDEKFAGNVSGQALKLKLLTMNLLVKGKMRQMERGLQERFALYNHWLNIKGEMPVVEIRDVDIVFTVSLPINEQEVVDTVTRLQGIVDDQTLLSQLWFIRDPAEALENIRRQKQENASLYTNNGRFGADEEDGDEPDDTAGRKIGFAAASDE